MQAVFLQGQKRKIALNGCPEIYFIRGYGKDKDSLVLGSLRPDDRGCREPDKAFRFKQFVKVVKCGGYDQIVRSREGLSDNGENKIVFGLVVLVPGHNGGLFERCEKVI